MTTQRDPEADYLPHCIMCDGRHSQRLQSCEDFAKKFEFNNATPKGGLMKFDIMANLNSQKLPRPLSKMIEHIQDARMHLVQSELSEARKVELDGVLQHALILIDDMGVRS